MKILELIFKPKAKWYDICLEWLLLATLFLVPLVFAPQLNVSFEIIKTVLFRSLTLLALLFFIIKIISEKKIPVPDLGKFKFLWILIFGYFFAVLLASIFSVAPALSFWGSYYRVSGAYTILHYGLFFFLLVSSVRTEEQKSKIFYTVIISAAIVSINGIIQYFAPSFMNFWDTDKFLGRIFSTMGHPNYLASYLIMIIPLCFGFYLASKKSSYLYFASLILMVFALFLTLSRAGIAALFLAIIFFVLVLCLRNGLRKLFWTFLAIPAILILTVISINIFSGSKFIQENPVLSRVLLSDENTRSVKTRLIMWPAVIDQILDRPILGYGPDTFSRAFPKYTPKELLLTEDMKSRADRAHNEILDVLAGSGIIGLIFHLSILITLLLIVLKEKNIITLALYSGILALFFANQFGFSLAVHNMCFWLFAAMILRLSFSGEKDLRIHLFEYDTVKALVFIFSLIFIVLNIFAYDIRLVQADHFYKKGLPEKAASAYPKQSQYFYDAAFSFAYNGEIEKAFDALAKGGNYDSQGDQYYFNLGRLNALSGKDFKEAYEAAASLAPAFPYTFLEWGIALHDIKKYEESIAAFEKYLDLAPVYWKWRLDSEPYSIQDEEKYRIFYKLNPDFNAVFNYLSDDYSKLGDTEKAKYYSMFAN